MVHVVLVSIDYREFHKWPVCFHEQPICFYKQPVYLHESKGRFISYNRALTSAGP